MIRKNQDESNWISVADMMTALMIIFMFIAINYILQIIEYKYVEEEIYNSLQSEFNEEIKDGDIELGPDGTIRFKTDEFNLFKPNSYRLTDYFQKELKEFIPRYWKILNSEKYLDYIKEIRIEGHSDTQPPNNGEDSYTYNLKLSSKRANKVLSFLREQESYQKASKAEKNRMDFLFTSIGFSYARALNDDKKYIHLDSNKIVNNDISRRVEFRIVTSNEKLVEKIYEKQSENEQ